MKLGFGLLLLVISPFLNALEITTETSDKAELSTVELLQALRMSHDTDKWEFTDKVHIKKKAIPHSHPVLTLHTRHTSKEQKDLLLSTYLHEQIHWYLDENLEQTNAAIQALKAIFKEVPVGYPEGARDEYSTYLHILVCFFEIEAISALLSKERVNAVSQFWKKDHYTWVYTQVDRRRPEIAKIVESVGLKIE